MFAVFSQLLQGQEKSQQAVHELQEELSQVDYDGKSQIRPSDLVCFLAKDCFELAVQSTLFPGDC